MLFFIALCFLSRFESLSTYHSVHHLPDEAVSYYPHRNLILTSDEASTPEDFSFISLMLHFKNQQFPISFFLLDCWLRKTSISFSCGLLVKYKRVADDEDDECQQSVVVRMAV
jgi:hypothetical protein